jgi:predicted metal-binding protein
VDDYTQFIEAAEELEFVNAKIISTKTIEVSHAVRWKCRYGCSGYGKKLTCPPNTPPVEETKKLIAEYKTGLLLHLQEKVNVEERLVQLENEIFFAGYHKPIAFSCGPCQLCADCADSCRKPKLARPTMEGCGIDVYATVRNNDWEIEVLESKEEQPNYFALILIE